MRSKYGSPGFARAPAVPAWARRNPRKNRGNLARHVLMYDLPTKELPSEADRDQLRNFEVVDARILHLGETPAWRQIRPILPPELGGDDRGDHHRSFRAPNISWQGRPTLARLSRSSKLPSSRPIAQSARHLARDRSGRDAKAARRARCDQAPSRRPLSHPVGSRRLDDLRSTGRSRRGDLLRRRPRTRRPSGRAVTAPSSYARRARSAGRDDSRSGAVMAPSCACLAPRQRALCGLTGCSSGGRAVVGKSRTD
jgi:hypothetical protein